MVRFRNFDNMNKYLLLVCAFALCESSCTKKEDVVVNDSKTNTGKIAVNFENYAGSDLLSLNNTWYKNENGDSLQFTIYNYFISNIKLIKDNGDIFAEDESYHLVTQANKASKSFTINNVPLGTYKSISFIIGVDSTRNVSGAQTGALAQTTGMFWDWNTGYIMAKMEANSPQSPYGNIVYHTGGFSGNNNSLRTVTINNVTISVGAEKTPVVYFKSDALEWFKTPRTISVRDMPVFGNSAGIKTIADNYADMFSIDHID